MLEELYVKERMRVYDILKKLNITSFTFYNSLHKFNIPIYSSTSSTNVKAMTDGQKGYIAGIIDGEGAIYFSSDKAVSQKLHPRVDVTNTNFEVILMLKNVIHGGYWIRNRRPDDSRWKPTHRLCLSRLFDINEVLLAISPYMIVKKKQANLMIEFVSLHRQHLNSREPCMEREFQIHKEVKLLNKRGKPE